MTTANLQAWLDQDDARVADMIRKYGWSVEFIFGGGCNCSSTCDAEGPPFAYSIGLFGMGHPELLMIGVPMETASGVINDLGSRIRAGADLIPGELITFDNWPHRIVAEEVPNPGEIVLGANRHYQRPSEFSVPVLQLSYDDVDGRFPWESDYIAPWLQPRPGSFRA